MKNFTLRLIILFIAFCACIPESTAQLVPKGALMPTPVAPKLTPPPRGNSKSTARKNTKPATSGVLKPLPPKTTPPAKTAPPKIKTPDSAAPTARTSKAKKKPSKPPKTTPKTKPIS